MRAGIALPLALLFVLAVTALVKVARSEDFQPQELSCL
jgi:hypothetical protein